MLLWWVDEGLDDDSENLHRASLTKEVWMAGCWMGFPIQLSFNSNKIYYSTKESPIMSLSSKGLRVGRLNVPIST